MGKQRTMERIRSGEDTIGTNDFQVDSAVKIFAVHYRLAYQSMSLTHAAANAHDAVQRYLLDLKEIEAGD